MRNRHALAALCALTLAAPALAATTIEVPKDQPTIGAAVAAAENGDTIVIKKGLYTESVTVSGFDGLTIKAKGKVLIDPPAGPGVLVEDSSNVSIQGIAVEDADDGFVFDGCQDVELKKFSVSGVNRHGVFAFGSSNVDVLGGKIENCGRDGVAFADELPGEPVTGGTISKVRIRNCEEDGIDVLGSDVLVVKCVATDCDDDCFESDDLGPGPVRFEKCRAIRSGDEGFELAAAGSVAVKCKASDTRDDGYDIEGDDCVLEKCTAKGADAAGFSVDDVDNAELIGCKAIKCGDQGFDFFDATNSSAEKCKAVRTRGDGFRLTFGTQSCVLTKCKGTKSGGFDLRDESDGSSTFPGSKFKTVFED